MIIGICGFIGSGKGTVGNYLVSQHGFTSLSFADTLKDAVAAIFHWPRDLLEGNTVEGRNWREQEDQWWTTKLGHSVTPRWVLQHIGTDVMRNHFHQNIWVMSVEKQLVDAANKNVVITDIRFHNEAAMIKAIPSAKTMWVRKSTLPDWYNDALADRRHITPGIMSQRWPNVHPSEWEWTDIKTDFVVYNDGSLADLYKTIDDLIVNN